MLISAIPPPGAPPVGHKLLGLVNLILRLSPTRILFLSFYFLSPLRGRAVALFSVEDKDIFFCLLLGATPVSPPGHECCRTDKDLFFVFYWVFVGYALSCEQRLIFWFFGYLWVRSTHV